MNKIIDEIKSKIYFNPRKTSKILENTAKQYNISKDNLIDQFIDTVSVHPYMYASLIEEADSKTNEGLGDVISGAVGAAKDAAVAKYGFGGAQQAAIGSQQRRERMNFLFQNWSRIAGSGKLQPTEQNLRAYLGAQQIAPAVINQAVALFKEYLKPAAPASSPQKVGDVSQPTPTASESIANEAVVSKILPSNQLRTFFDKVAELEIQNAMKSSAKINKQGYTQKAKAQDLNKLPTTPKQAQDQLKNIELYISKMPKAERDKFLTKRLAPLAMRP